MKNRRAGRIRLLLAVVLVAIGVVVGWPTISGTGAPEDFEGAVIVVPRKPDVNMGVRVEYVPPTTESLAQARDGQISISISPQRADEDAVHDTGTSHWYVLLTGDAQLHDAQIVDDYGSGPARAAPSVRSDFVGTEYQWFELELAAGQSLRGTPQQSPLIEVAGRYELTMPNVLSTEPTEGWERDGGVVFVEEPWIDLAKQETWYAPKTAHFLVSGGIPETSAISVARTTPDVDEARWGDLIIWDADRPLATRATFVDSRTTTGPDLRLGVAFLFMGAALPLFIEAFVPNEDPSAPTPPKDVGNPPRTTNKTPRKNKPQRRLNRRRK